MMTALFTRILLVFFPYLIRLLKLLIYSVLKDLLLRCDLSLKLCGGQAYDGASVMQGNKGGVATRIRQDVPQALPVHCLTHSLNLCLQDAERQIPLFKRCPGYRS